MSVLQVWFKHDLRLDDHPGLHNAVAAGTALVPVYCFDPSQLLHLLRASHGSEGDRAIATYTYVVTLRICPYTYTCTAVIIQRMSQVSLCVFTHACMPLHRHGYS